MAVRSGRGDQGFTELSFQKQISKDSRDIQALGDLDELNSYLGLIKSKSKKKSNKTIIEKIQNGILVIASEIVVGYKEQKKLGMLLTETETEWIKKTIFQLESERKLEKCFHLPGENEFSSFLDIARAVARRAERSVVGLFHNDKIKNENVLPYLNCISDVLFILARNEERTDKSARHTVKTKKTTAVKSKRIKVEGTQTKDEYEI